ncbi:hypothetical protein [Methanobacterium spitsbergense]|uniref:Uncharacterized protein n=1 Tax=Methanobacterium spitsbergense TaxID=2874285 RepID=A0A8T5V583_9EURY|nr:hypothetical protein [Methanobacterium spitsbergense]MBZ2167051.1 hypothetical protein [Methanobacterium spitsbergense]
MSVSNSKYAFNVLIREKSRLRLSLIFKENYQNKYPSFSQGVEDVIIEGLNSLEGSE